MRVGIFADAGEGIGYGHYGRCRALKEGFAERDIAASLFIRGKADKAIVGEDVELVSWLDSLDLFKQFDVCIIDSYLTTIEELSKISSVCKLSVFIDDYNRLTYPKGVVVNGSIYGDSLLYPEIKNQTLLIGRDYIMLRKPFWDIPHEEGVKHRGVFFSSGGSGADTDFICLELLKLTEHEIIAIGKTFKNPRIQSFSGLNAEQMMELMSTCVFAVSAAGQTSYELARMGIPSIFYGLAENQRLNLEAWKQSGFAISVGFYSDKEFSKTLKKAVAFVQCPENLNKMSRMGKALVDGQGVRRITDIIIGMVI